MRSLRIKSLWIVSLSILLSGCLVGPHYRIPHTEMPQKFRESECQETLCMEDECFFRWWEGFEDELLNELLNEAARYNFDLQIAIEKICQARGQFNIDTANLLPAINFDSIVTRSRNSLAVDGSRFLGPVIQDFFLVGFDAMWEIDFFGRLRRLRRSSFYTWEATVEDARNLQILVLSEVARNYVLIRALQKKADIVSQIIQADLAELALAEDLLKSGLGNCIDVEAASAVLDNDIAALDVIESDLGQGMYAMGVLVGQTPEWIADRLAPIAPIPSGSGRIPAGLPSELLRRRHDIKSAERQLAATTELIGAAVAELFPQVTLTSTNLFGARSRSSNFGWASTDPKNLFKNISKTWSVGPAIYMPLLDWGSRLANIDIQTSQQRQAFLNYEKTVVTALQEVEQALVAYFKEEDRLNALRAQTEANLRAYEYTYSLLQAGLANCTQVWEAQKTWLFSQNQLADSEQALTVDLIALYKTLGGDWECFYSP